MSGDAFHKKTKFAIDGDIKSPKESAYLKELDKHKAKRFRRLSIFLGIGLAVCFVFAIFQFIQIQSLQRQTNALIDANAQSSIQQALDSAQFKVDSLSIVVAKLRLSNDLLKENFDASEGIFFEVQMEFEGDFDLQQYKQELNKLVSSEFDARDKLLLGRFKSFKKALLFENDLKKMGLKNLYLLGRVDGKIMTFKEALAVAQSQNK